MDLISWKSNKYQSRDVLVVIIMVLIVTGTQALKTSYSIPSMVHGYHKYLHVWDAAIGEILPCNSEDSNLHDPYTMAVKKGTITVGHVPKKISCICSVFVR